MSDANGRVVEAPPALAQHRGYGLHPFAETAAPLARDGHDLVAPRGRVIPDELATARAALLRLHDLRRVDVFEECQLALRALVSGLPSALTPGRLLRDVHEPSLDGGLLDVRDVSSVCGTCSAPARRTERSARHSSSRFGALLAMTAAGLA